MKKLVLTLTSLILSCAAFAVSPGDTFYDNGINYWVLDESTVRIYYNTAAPDNKYSGDIIIPATVTKDGVTYNVTLNNVDGLNTSTVTSLTFGEGIDLTNPGNFSYMLELEKIVFPRKMVTKGDEWVPEDRRPRHMVMIESPKLAHFFSRVGDGKFALKLDYFNCFYDDGERVRPYLIAVNEEPYTGRRKYLDDEGEFVFDSTDDMLLYQCMLLGSGYYCLYMYVDADNGRPGAAIRINVHKGDTGIMQTVGGTEYTWTFGSFSVMPQDNPADVTGEVEIPDQIEREGVMYPVTSISESAFAGTGITRLSIPAGVESLGDSFCRNCPNLTEVEFRSAPPRMARADEPQSFTEIPYWAFEGCVSLAWVNVPESVKRVNLRAFAGCKSITSFTVYPHTYYFSPFNESSVVGLSDVELAGDKVRAKLWGILTTPEGAAVPLACSILYNGDRQYFYPDGNGYVEIPAEALFAGFGTPDVAEWGRTVNIEPDARSVQYADIFSTFAGVEVKYSEVSAVAEVEVADDCDSPVEYFSLQGVKVANPGPGLYIRRIGSSVTKVRVR